MSKVTLTGLAVLMAGALSSFAQSPGLGLNFAATDPDEPTSSLFPEEFAGVVPQANWNNLTGPSGTGVTGLSYDNNGTAVASTATVTWSSPNTWRSGGNNLLPDGPDHRLTSGYLDTGNTAANGISITVENIDSTLTSEGYDVYVYFVSDSNGNRGGAYILDPGTGPITKYGSTMGSPTEYVEDPGTDANLSQDGNYLRFTGLTGSSFTLRTDTTLTTPNGFRAPINALQIVPTVPFGPDFTTQPSDATVYAGRTVQFTAAATGFPAVTAVRWQKDGADLTESARITGVNTSTLTITDVAAGDAGEYRLMATSTRGTNPSDAATLAIVAPDGSDYETALLAAGPLATWRLNEAETVTQAFDYVGGLAGTYGETVFHGTSLAGPQSTEFPGFSSVNTAASFDGVGFITVPTKPLNTNAVTIITWIQPNAPQFDFTGLFMTRSGTQAGLGYTTDNQLGYTWNNNSTWSWNSGLRPPDGQWSMVALVIQQDKATLYLGAGGEISVAINPIGHTPEAWGGDALIGNDSGGTFRAFTGNIDEVAVFNRALSFQEVAGLFEEATGIPQEIPPVVSPQPQSATRYVGSDLQLISGAAGENVTFQWQKDGADLVDADRISGSTTDSLTINNLTSADSGNYTLIASNAVGDTTSDVAIISVIEPAHAYVSDVLELNPISYWRLNETGDPVAQDFWGGRNGTWGVAAQSAPGPRPEDGYGRFEADNTGLLPTANLADSWVTVPGPGITTDTITMLAWINPSTLVNNAGIVFARAGQPATALNLNGTGNLGYHWLDAAATYGFVSGLVPPLNQWSLVALVVEPTQATVHMINANGAQSAVNTFAHAPRAFTDNIRIGGDPNNANRTFDGRIDEVAIFGGALTGEQLQALYQEALGVIAPTIVGQPTAREAFPADSTSFTVAASGTAPLTYQWQKGSGATFADLADGANVSGATTATLTLSNIAATDAAEYRVVVSNSQGTATSNPAALTVLTTPPAPAEGSFGSAVLASGALSYYRLNETADPSTGVVQAYDYAGGRHAIYGTAALNGFSGIAGPRPADGFDVFEESNTALGVTLATANSWVTAPPLGVTTDTMTILAWINPNSLVANGGIVFARAGQPATGMNLNGAGNLGYHWLDTAASYNWDSALTPPIGQWSLAAIVVEPTQATAYLVNANGSQSAVNTTAHAARTFSDTIRIGGDPGTVDRTFDGAIDEVAFLDVALTAEQIAAIYAGEAPAVGAELGVSQSGGQITISWDLPGTLQSTTDLQGEATVWTDETTTGNTLTVTPTGPARFYRLLR